ncbi:MULTISPECIES: alpha/beta fold hydrolase [unclassified Plantibacter]|uniref:alpha/beta fold hydrolase n=1 Tax=unclassified Plantibacter TaxID=2624265 RepID=UPI000B012E6A|nr:MULTISPECIES: alpha/beta hydrolase [unclassified Plantibacter]
MLPQPEPIAPTYVMSSDGFRIATYVHEPAADADRAETVVAVHGFASSAGLNWDLAGWTRTLTRAGYRLVTIDQRGHGASDKPTDPSAYRLDGLVDDVLTVLDGYSVDEPHYLGYSLGSRVGWRLGVRHPDRVRSLSLGGLPEGDSLRGFDLDEARLRVRTGATITHRLTETYVSMAEGVPGNDVEALIALVEGLRGGPQPTTAEVPPLPMLLVTGDDDAVADGSRRLAEAAGARYVGLPGREHFNAVSSRVFKDAVLAFLAEQG